MAGKSPLGASSDAMAQAARSKQMSDMVVRSMDPKTLEIDEAVAASEAAPAKRAKAAEPKEWLLTHDTTLSAVAAGGTFVMRAGTKFSDPSTKHSLDAVHAKYVAVG